MGEYLRRFWLPALQSEDAPTNEGEPYRIKLLGESLLAFRNTEGRVGILQEACAHRGVSLFYGRNEDCGLRCVFHGWKYDVDGHVVDMPNEPPESRFKEKIKPIGYPTAEVGGVVWVFMGQGNPPPLPDFAWVSAEHLVVTKRYQDCNWLAVVEGGVDSSHVTFLHSTLKDDEGKERPNPIPGIGETLQTNDGFPRFDIVETKYGYMVGARRNVADPDRYYWRITQLVLPFYWMAPSPEDGPYYSCKIAVPVDDDNTINWTISWHPQRPISDEDLAVIMAGVGQHVVDVLPPDPSKPYGNCRPSQNRWNVYEIDRERQKRAEFTGVHGLGMQDQYIQESMGVVPDTAREHLGSSDLAVIKLRRRLHQEIDREQDRSAYPYTTNSLRDLRGATMFLDKNTSWIQEIVDKIDLPDVLYES
ncbi:Rieske 2Fe-2S domain-containing protein [Rhodococcus pseudokoreensis]|uniref:Rieske 2Fe-2S domain-containing protein n=1 Tax=Rhodococcus pseudokoreensis TaxID=2811421 RepID=A0A974ZX65_9NOCA|nr:Rieske 2Fe-2S domain-containing protein [Rhodococcus pseudokoreensis]QSE93756.1 Rieske 2Fe-2S domain-containing protein [Rhodococcus pseudokoreensis]